jgi:ribose-phosphate pyrophosphokinase
LVLCERLVRCGIEEIFLICTHGVFSGDALPQLTRIEQIREIVTTDTVPIPPEKMSPIMTVLSVAPIFGEAIWRNSTRQSIGELFPFSDESLDPIDIDE